MKYDVYVKKRRIPGNLLIAAIAIGLALIGATVLVRQTYYNNLRPVSSQGQSQYFTVVSGSSAEQIANQLSAAGLIRSSQAFQWYVSVHNSRDKLQAGTYRFSPSQSIPQIVDAMVNGKIATDLVTILPGKTINEVRQAFIKAGFKPAAVDAAFRPGQYRNDYPALADNPQSANLEGFMYPDTFQKTANTDPRHIVQESLKGMQEHLTSDIRAGFVKHGLTVYQGVTLASIIEQEVSNDTDRAKAAQVFIKRLKVGMPLGSDPTAFYGSLLAGQGKLLDYDSPYNTLLHTGLPPGPIGTVSASSLKAVAHPAGTDWLYFVSGDDGTTHFSKTLEEHHANTEKYCHKLCLGTD